MIFHLSITDLPSRQRKLSQQHIYLLDYNIQTFTCILLRFVSSTNTCFTSKFNYHISSDIIYQYNIYTEFKYMNSVFLLLQPIKKRLQFHRVWKKMSLEYKFFVSLISIELILDEDIKSLLNIWQSNRPTEDNNEVKIWVFQCILHFLSKCHRKAKGFYTFLLKCNRNVIGYVQIKHWFNFELKL